MAKGRKAQTALPDFIELSDDRKKVRCSICKALRGQNNVWIQKESLSSHLKSDVHARSVHAKQDRDSIHSAVEQSLREESAIEERMDFATLSSTIEPAATTKAPVSKPSAEEQEMWDDGAFSNDIFSAGIDHTAAAVEERKRLEKEAADFDLWRGADFLPEEDPNDGELLLDELEQEDILTELLRNAHVNIPEGADILDKEAQDRASQPKTSEAWSPYASKTMFLLDTLDNLPRMRLSNSLMNAFLWVLREAGARDVPSLYRLRQVQTSLRKSSGVPTVQHKSPKGNIYSMNDPRTLVAMDWANPLKWRKDVDRHTLSPMYDAGDRHYYIDELARLKNGNFIIPVRWLEDNEGNVFADAYAVTFNDQFVANVVDSDVILVKSSDLQDNILDLTDWGLLPTWDRQSIESGYPAHMPNPDRALAEGDPLYTSWIDVFGDDVSGNRSKSWNKHWNTYISHRNLPRKLLQQEFHVHFISTSPVASISEQFHGIKQVIEAMHKKPVKVRHGTSGMQVRFKIYANSGPGDNPAQSEACGHIGGNGNHPCRKCFVGGTQQDKETDIGFHSLFEAGVARSAEGILLDVKSQVELACLGIAQNVQNQQTKNGIKDAYTQFWIDDLIARARILRKNHPERTALEIQAELLTWFKTIAQVNVFHVYDLVDATRFLLTKAVGELASLLWIPEIRNMEEYLSDIEVAAANVLDLFAMIDPSKMTSKIKLHLLVHLKEDILRFGPLVGVATEVFERFNAVFRFCSIFSNHLAPSRDIALQLAGQETLKHRLTGGWWPTVDGEWERPGPSVRNFIHTHPTLQALVGWTSAEPLVNGSFRLEPLKRGTSQKAESRKYIPWFQTQGAKALNCVSEDADSQWTPCRFAIARSEDKCVVGSWIFAKSPLTPSELITGRIVEILANTTSDRAVVILDVFQVLSTRHQIFGMPMLARRQEETTYVVIPSTGIDFLYNVQHDCPLSKCTASGKRPLMQERIESGLIQTYIEHRPIERFVINTHAFHNAHLLRATLPRSLVAPILLHPNRRAKHFEIAGGLRVTQDAKRKARAAQKKNEAINPADNTGSGPNKRKRLETENLDGAVMV
ncbi:hypothetical protein NLJ89_g342 [Agrocybe chaxingu]|uniref:Uncharacterized protein n=1 Tax=Agrocybe chaxingu TaxID=84603 RepID=A0A9W8N276_9AGAR|nr:hypothetical protein NLJ89_g342 [Agrocybe chaxingu]